MMLGWNLASYLAFPASALLAEQAFSREFLKKVWTQVHQFLLQLSRVHVKNSLYFTSHITRGKKEEWKEVSRSNSIGNTCYAG